MEKIVRSLARTAAVLAAACTLTVASASAQDFPETEIRLGTIAVGDPFYHLGSLKFAKLVSERTGGKVEVKVYPGAQLGNEKDLVEQVQTGIIQMTITGSPMLSIFPGYGPLGTFSMPYVFEGDIDEARVANLLRVAHGPIGEEIAEKGLAASGIRSLDLAWWAGTQNLATRDKLVEKVADIEGLKIRTPDTPIYRAALAALGAAVTPMAWSEVYSALQLGVIDGMANTPDLMYNAKLGEVQKYLALTGHLDQIQVVVINGAFYDGLSPELQQVLTQAAIDAGTYQTELALTKNAEYLKLLEAQGMTITAVDLDEFKESTKDAWKDFESSFEGYYERVVAAQQ
jgi:tripartite ATP-independent transporter DctP family solute receptor